MHILFAGGGTAGHINPALAIAAHIKERHPDAKISFIGTPNRLEARLIPEAGYDFYTIEVEGFQRKLTPENIKRNVSAAYKAVKSSMDAKKLLKKLQPDVVVGTGGYVSGPVLREAAKLCIKTAVHEQNAYPGITNKMLSSKVDRVMLAMPEARERMKLKNEPIIVGNPVRGSVMKADKAQARRTLGIDERPMILSFGGSLGARVINQTAADVLAWHWRSGKYFHFHAAGSSGYNDMKELLKQKGVELGNAPTVRFSEYINDMDLCMAAADLVICRAGAITLSELQVQGKAAILIPSPYVAENHQYHNAMTLKKLGAAEVIEEKELTGEKLVEEVKKLLEDPEKLKKMGEASASSAIRDVHDRIYNVIMELYNSR